MINKGDFFDAIDKKDCKLFVNLNSLHAFRG